MAFRYELTIPALVRKGNTESSKFYKANFVFCCLLLSTYKPFFCINTRNLTYFPRDSRGFRATRNFTHFYLMLDQCILLHLIASNFVVVFVLQPRDKLGPRPRVNNFD